VKKLFTITCFLSGSLAFAYDANFYTAPHQNRNISSEERALSGYDFYDRQATPEESNLFLSDLKIETAKLSTEEVTDKCTLSPCAPLYYDFNALTQPSVALNIGDIKTNIAVTNQILGKCGILAGKINIYSGTLKNNPDTTLSHSGNEGVNFVNSNGLGQVLKGINTAYLNDTGRNNLGYTMVQEINGAPAGGVNFAKYKEFIEQYGIGAIRYISKSSSMFSTLFAVIAKWFQQNSEVLNRYQAIHFGSPTLSSTPPSPRLGGRSHHSFANMGSRDGKSSGDGSYWTFVNGPEDKNEDRTTTAHEILHSLGIPHCGFEGEPCSSDNVMNSGTNNQIAITPGQCQTARRIGQQMGVLKTSP
jgi:hypothetical protein